MDDQTRRIISTLVETMQADTKRLATLQAHVGIANQLLIRLVGKTDLLADLPSEMRSSLERVLEIALSTCDLQDDPDLTQAFVALIRSRIEQLNGSPE